MDTISVFHAKYQIGLNDIDFTKKMKLSSLFAYFQDAACSHADIIGYGMEALEKNYNVTWVLLRIKVDIIRNPEWYEEISIETWPQIPKKLEFERDFIVRDKEGDVIIRATSTWVLLDKITREIRKSDVVDAKLQQAKTERALDCRLGKIKPFNELIYAYKKVIGYSDVDINGHLNNTKYIDYIMDCFPLESHRLYGVKSIEVNYINEALPGDTIVLYNDISSLDSNQIYIEGMNEKDNKVIFRSLVEIHKNK